jgi:hypothetical protein
MQILRRSVATAAVFFALVASAAAQGATTIRVYLVPKIGTGARTDAYRPKYLADWGQTHPVDGQIEAVMMDYGVEATYLVLAVVTPAQHTEIVSNIDVTAVPTPYTDNVSAVALTKVQQSLESALIPGNWITTSNTWADVVRSTVKSILVMQRFAGMFGQLFTSGVTLDTTVGQLTAAQRQNLRAAAQSMGIDTSGATGSTTVRTAILIFSAQLPPVTFTLGGQTLTF